MAMMMPVVKKNYNIYGDRGDPLVQRKTSQGAASITSGKAIHGRRRVKSECPTVATSPPKHGDQVIIHRIPIPRNNSHHGQAPSASVPRSLPVPLGMTKGRGSAPVFNTGGAPPFFRQNSVPDGPHGKAPRSPTHSNGSGSSEEEEEGQSSSGGGFHKLFRRLKRSLRIKEPAPAAS